MLTMFAMQDVFAQSLEGYKAINLKEEFNDNAFTFFSRAPILLSGDETAHNAMTIGWGSLGNYLGYDRLTVSSLGLIVFFWKSPYEFQTFR